MLVLCALFSSGNSAYWTWFFFLTSDTVPMLKRLFAMIQKQWLEMASTKRAHAEEPPIN